MQRIDWSEIPADEVYPGIRRQVLQGVRQTIVRYLYAPDSAFPIHSHPQEQVTLVIAGEIEFTVDGRSLTLRAGQAAIIPANIPHGARVIGPTTVETFNALSPRRDDQPAQTR